MSGSQKRKMKGRWKGTSSLNPLEVTSRKAPAIIVGGTTMVTHLLSASLCSEAVTSKRRADSRYMEDRVLLAYLGSGRLWAGSRITCTAALPVDWQWGEGVAATVLRAEIDQNHLQFTIKTSLGSWKPSRDSGVPKLLYQILPVQLLSRLEDRFLLFPTLSSEFSHIKHFCFSSKILPS